MVDIVTRAGKGSALTHNELDANFQNLNAGVLVVENTLAAQQATIAATLTEAQTLAATAEGAAALAQSAAASAGSVMQQDLSAIDKTLFTSAAVVAICHDWDGRITPYDGWRDRCSHTSWENETLSGNWLGSASNEAAARAISGATTGSYYYDTTAAIFRKLNAGSGVTEVFRGNARKYPADRLITAESGRVIIWDLTQPGVPMWMVFSGANALLYAAGGSVGVAAVNGTVAIVQSTAYCEASIAQDAMSNRLVSGLYRSTRNIAARQSAWASSGAVASGAIVSSVCNAVTMTVLPTAPADAATGLPIPTIAVATNGGVSVIKDDGSVWDITSSDSGYGYIKKVLLEKGTGKVLFTHDVAGYGRLSARVHALPTADVVFTFNTKSTSLEYYPAPIMSDGGDLPLFSGLGDIGYGSIVPKAIGTNVGLTLFKRNNAMPSFSMDAYVTSAYNSGWKVGATKGAWLADTVAETLTGTELITNGDFAAGTTGWSAVNSGSIAVASGELTVTNGASNNGTGEQAITTEAGKTYVVSATARIGTATPVYIVAGTTSGAFNLGASSTTSVSNVPVALTFTATGTTTYIGLRNTSGSGLTGIYDNVSCRRAAVDRSVKAKGLRAFGSLTKAPVASGAQLVGYSGFSAANYLEQPYNADLDFGSGDFYYMGWIKPVANGAVQEVIFRSAYSGSYAGAMSALYMDGTCRMFAYLSDDAAATYDQVVSSGGYADTNHHFVVMLVRSAVLELWVDGVKVGQAAVASAALGQTNTAAKLMIGSNPPGTSPCAATTVLSLIRVGATAPSAEQIKDIYETERLLFAPNAQCCLAGTSNAVTALADDDETDLLHVSTSYGRSAFKGLVRVASEATPVGAIVALAAGAGVVAQAGASGVDVYVPAYSLREELLRDAEQAAVLGSPLEFKDFDATAAQAAFELPVGYEPVAVYAASGAGSATLQREGAGKQWTRSFNGFYWAVTFASGRSTSDWISIGMRRVRR